MNTMNKYDVSVVVATYNPDFENLKRTIYSVLNQRSVRFEIIVADDGSKENHIDKLNDIFQSYGFSDYKYSISPENCGTVKNISRALSLCNGRYLKLISPGDYLYDSSTLKDWIEYSDENECRVSFSRYVKYAPDINFSKDYINHISVGDRPWNLSVYTPINRKKISYRYLLLDDFCLGAATLINTDVFKKYIDLIEGTVIFCEDAVYRLMIADGMIPLFFDRYTIWYSYGDGISTKRNKRWANIIDLDHYNAGLVIRNRIGCLDWFEFRYRILLKLSKYNFIKATIKYAIFPSLILYRLSKYNNLNYKEYDVQLLKQLFDL